jgi:NAD(P)-dependent dehydrogenase (short-subunit alcohol dehydrogenase family)
MSNTLSNKVALVTGGSRGIGAAIVRRLARMVAVNVRAVFVAVRAAVRHMGEGGRQPGRVSGRPGVELRYRRSADGRRRLSGLRATSVTSDAVSTDREQMSSRDRANLSVVCGYPVVRAWAAPRRGDAGCRER